MFVLTEVSGVTPELIMTRSGNQVTVALNYFLPGFFDEEAFVFVFNGDAYSELGAANDFASQSGDGDPGLFLGYTATLVAGVATAGLYTVNDYDSATTLEQTYRVILFDTAATYTGNSAMDVIFGSAQDDAFYGGGGSDAMEGGDGEDTLHGGSGDDRLHGGLDDDTYYVNSQGDVVIEEAGGGGSDRIAASASYRLAAGIAVEVMTTTSVGGTAAINLTGNAYSQSITGNAGDNVLSDGGYGGWDILRGSLGNDTYSVNNAGTQIVEVAGQGFDRVSASTSFALAADDDIERMTTSSAAGTRSIHLTGNALAQEIYGNAGANRLNGGGGHDTLAGGAGADTFIFDSAQGAGNVDRITDFSVADDTVRLENAIFTGLATGALAAAAFRANTTGLAGDADDRIIHETDSGNLFFDADGTGAGAAVRFAVLDAGLGLTSADFTVI